TTHPHGTAPQAHTSTPNHSPPTGHAPGRQTQTGAPPTRGTDPPPPDAPRPDSRATSTSRAPPPHSRHQHEPPGTGHPLAPPDRPPATRLVNKPRLVHHPHAVPIHRHLMRLDPTLVRRAPVGPLHHIAATNTSNPVRVTPSTPPTDIDSP